MIVEAVPMPFERTYFIWTDGIICYLRGVDQFTRTKEWLLNVKRKRYL